MSGATESQQSTARQANEFTAKVKLMVSVNSVNL